MVVLVLSQGFFLAALLSWGYHDSWLHFYAHTNPGPWTALFLTVLAHGAVAGGALLFWHGRQAMPLALSALLSLVLVGLCVQLAKHQLFADWHRPWAFRQLWPDLQPPGCMHTLQRRSFPSGHAANAAVLGFWLALGARPWIQVAVAVLAVLAGSSRVWLGVHFPGDVLAGMAVGTLGSLLIYFMVQRLPRPTWLRHLEAPRARRALAAVALLVALGAAVSEWLVHLHCLS